jgi:hypothetical protein
VSRPEVFLSHASPDRAFVERLSRALDEANIRHFYTKHRIASARQWHEELGDALAKCNWFVPILTPSAVRSVWVKRELLFALQSNAYKDRVAPLLVKVCEASKLSWTLSSFQPIEFRSRFEQGCEELIRLVHSPSR